MLPGHVNLASIGKVKQRFWPPQKLKHKKGSKLLLLLSGFKRQLALVPTPGESINVCYQSINTLRGQNLLRATLSTVHLCHTIIHAVLAHVVIPIADGKRENVKYIVDNDIDT